MPIKKTTDELRKEINSAIYYSAGQPFTFFNERFILCTNDEYNDTFPNDGIGWTLSRSNGETIAENIQDVDGLLYELSADYHVKYNADKDTFKSYRTKNVVNKGDVF